MSSTTTTITSNHSDNKNEKTNNKSGLTATAYTKAELPKVTVPQRYMTASMPTRGAYHSEKMLLHHAYPNDEGYFINSDERLLISQPLPDTVRIVNEKPNIGKKDSCWLGW